MKHNLTRIELFDLFSVDTLESMRKDLEIEIQTAENKDVIKIHNEIVIIEKAIALKQGQLTLVGNLEI